MDLTALLLFGGALFFLMILGPMRRQKKEKNFLNGLKRGDRLLPKAECMEKLLKL